MPEPMTEDRLNEIEALHDGCCAEVENLIAEIRRQRAKLAEASEPTFPLEPRWKPGDRVEEVLYRGNTYTSYGLRPGTVARIDRTLHWHESLVVKFDDGEERAINPDVMRHIKETTDARSE